MRGRFISISPPNKGPGSNLESEKGEQLFQSTVDYPPRTSKPLLAFFAFL
jgi:hypothetical protein